LTTVVEAYLEHLTKQGLKPASVVTARYRLKAITQMVARDRLLVSVTPAIASGLYAARVAKAKPDTHRAELTMVSAMFGWCVERGWIRSNPFADVKPEGRKSRRRAHLRIDEARKFLDAALSDATDAGPACALALLMGLRASEITGLRVRDIDDGARVLWVADAKTEAGVRHLEIPEELRARLQRQVADRDGDERVFGDADRQWLYYHCERLCGAANVPEVSPHALRRTWSAIGAEAMPVDAVARALGQRGGTVNRRHYQPSGSEQRRTSGAALRSIQGGRP
jgi:integrase